MNNPKILALIHIANYYKLYLNYYFQNYRKAFEYSTIAGQSVEGSLSTPRQPLFVFYSTLAGLAVFSELSKGERKKVLKQTRVNLKRMKRWTDYAAGELLTQVVAYAGRTVSGAG